MIHRAYVKGVWEVDELIAELEHTFKSFDLKTILPITGGYIIYYSLGPGDKK